MTELDKFQIEQAKDVNDYVERCRVRLYLMNILIKMRCYTQRWRLYKWDRIYEEAYRQRYMSYMSEMEL